MWVLLSVYPELSDDGEVLEIVGCFTDIRFLLYLFTENRMLMASNSQQKWGEKIQAARAADAQEAKR